MKNRLPWIVFLGAAALVISRSWITEDAYISFRSINNLFSGFGLDYNPGERVESYSHPIWAFMLFVPASLGWPVPVSAFFLGLAASLTGLGVLALRAARSGAFPASILALCSVTGFLDFATSGMEFSLAFLLLVLFYTEKRSLRERPFYFSMLLNLLYHTRPETALLFVYYSGFFVWEVCRKHPYETRSMKRIAQDVFFWGLPALLVSGTIHGFRFLYYGEPFSNIYFAKAGFGSYYEQGLKYLLFFIMHGPALLIAGLILAVMLASDRSRRSLAPLEIASTVRDTGASLLLLLYVVRVGGDFMAFRLLLPSFVIVCLLLDRFAASWRLTQVHQTALIAVALLLAFLPVPINRGYIADERRVFLGIGAGRVFESSSNAWARRGSEFARLQNCLGYEPFVIANSMTQAKCLRGVGLGYVGVAAGPHVNILDEQGLTDRQTARSRVITRFRPGHEHYNTLEQVVAKGALFCATGEPAYDRLMAGPAGILIRLDPYLIATQPDPEAILAGLERLKREGSGIIPRLEARYMPLEELSRKTRDLMRDPAVQRRQMCWRNFQGGPDTYFY